MKKVTFTFDHATVAAIRRAAKRWNKPQSAIVREAVAAYGANEDRVPEAERRRMVNILEAHMATAPRRSRASVDKELRDLHESRRAGWRRKSDRRRR
jgi:hypothetical protein